MIHPSDADSIQRMIGLVENDLPEKFNEEYRIRLRMQHSDGHAGPLGTHGLIDVIRWAGLGPMPQTDQEAKTDWNSIKRDGSVHVEARFGGLWMPGIFKGFVKDGILAVLLDNDDWIRECRPHMVRLVETDPLKVPEPPPAAFATLEGQKTVETAVAHQEPTSVTTSETASSPKKPTVPEPDEELPGDNTSAPPDVFLDPGEVLPPEVDFNWFAVRLGSKVWVRSEDDVIDGVFAGIVPSDEIQAPGLHVRVRVDSGVTILPAVDVHYAGA